MDFKKEIVNGELVKVLYYKDSEGIFSFEPSVYFQNPDQMSPYIPGSGSLARTKEELDFKLNLYLDQVLQDARLFPNDCFDHESWNRLCNGIQKLD